MFVVVKLFIFELDCFNTYGYWVFLPIASQRLFGAAHFHGYWCIWCSEFFFPNIHRAKLFLAFYYLVILARMLSGFSSAHILHVSVFLNIHKEFLLANAFSLLMISVTCVLIFVAFGFHPFWFFVLSHSFLMVCMVFGFSWGPIWL